ncbi:MAG: alpha/beta fold hydrolase [Planctomycetaceae bacterium]|nr:alpha/beta fold hydrolase [Planctomycetales bacterium]MCB9924381.1 alpha/beta fold hydrolase [Planctomycetaceae bacterium]
MNRKKPTPNPKGDQRSPVTTHGGSDQSSTLPATNPSNPLAAGDATVLETLQEIAKLLKADKKAKDWWDKFATISTFASALVIAAIGWYFTHTQAVRENKLTELDLLVKFMPYLTGEEEEPKKLAITSISRLGSPELAASVAAANPSLGTLAGVIAIAETPGLSAQDLEHANVATQSILSNFPVATIRFATDRSLEAGTTISYGTKRAGLSYGEGIVSIPPTHKVGAIEMPSFWRKAQEDKHVMLRSVTAYDESQLFSSLDADLAQSGSDEITVYVPGYNMSFQSAMMRSAQLVHDLQLDSPTVLFSWPSAGRATSYLADTSAAEAAVADFSEFIKRLKANTKAKQLNIIGHSMGCRIVLKSLAEISVATPDATEAMLNELVLVAPDVDRDIFADQLGPAAIRLASRVTLYVFDNDAALAAARTMNASPRLGESSAGLVIMPGLETIVVESANSFFETSYFAASPFLGDLRQLLQGAPAAKRFGLRPAVSNGMTYWILTN